MKKSGAAVMLGGEEQIPILQVFFSSNWVSGKESSDPPLPCFDTPTYPRELPLYLALPT